MKILKTAIMKKLNIDHENAGLNSPDYEMRKKMFSYELEMAKKPVERRKASGFTQGFLADCSTHF